MRKSLLGLDAKLLVSVVTCFMELKYCNCCSKLKHLSKEYLDNASASDLHELKWADRIGEIPRSYNHLVGIYKPHNKIKALHYTNGGPWFDEYKNGEKSLDWWTVYEAL